jgi:cell division protein FtsX
METLLIKVSERQKANMLVELLKSMDFIESVDYMGDLKSFKEAVNTINEIASATELKELTMDDINNEIKEYRLEKRSRGN